MIELIGKTKPEVDEFKLHFRTITNIMKRYKRVVIFAYPGSGKSKLMYSLKTKYEKTNWNFYDLSEHHDQIKEPFVYATFHTELLPPADIYYPVQYSTEYKEAISGIRFKDGFPRPITDYMRISDWHDFSKVDLRGKRFKNKAELIRAIGKNIS